MRAERQLSDSHVRPFGYTASAHSHAGTRRRINEDAFLNRPHLGLWAVADGMGGHGAGDFASTTVIDLLAKVSTFHSAFAFRRSVTTALANANRLLQAKAEAELVETIGSTVVTLLAYEGHYACLWAGDSRAYLLRRGKLVQLTHDHSVTQEMLDAGLLTLDEKKGHEQNHVVTRAVGGEGDLDLGAAYGRIEAGDRFLLCSDGLTGAIDEKVLGPLMGLGDLEAAGEGLLAEALARGAVDNVTLIVIDVDRAD